MKKNSLIGTAALLAILGLAATDAHAADRKFYPGAGCVQTSELGTLGYFAGTVDNLSSTGDLDVICPLVRDASSIDSATIQVFDRNPVFGFNVECTIFYEVASGSSITHSSDTEESTSSSANVQTLTFGALTGGNYYYATCRIPRTSSGDISHVVRFDINEAD